MKKSLSLLFVGVGLLAISFGLVNKPHETQQVKAEEKQLTFDSDGFITFGSYYSSYDKEMTLKYLSDFTSYAVDETGKMLFSDDESYGFIKSISAGKNAGSYKVKISDTETATLSELSHSSGVFKKEPIKWVKYDEDKDYTYLISNKILFRCTYNDPSVDHLEYQVSQLKSFLEYFEEFAFTVEEKEYLQEMKIGDVLKAKVSIPVLSKVVTNEPKMDKATDYAICDNLSFNKGVDHLPYWTMTTSGSPNRISVRWYNSETTDCLQSDSEIGVRPIILVKVAAAPSGGGSSAPSSPTPTTQTTNPSLIIAIITAVLGVGALTAFSIIWGKKAKLGGFKAPGWYYVIIFISVGICSVSIITFTTSTTSGGLGGVQLIYGYYVQTYEQYSGTSSSGIDFVQVGYNGYVIRSNGTCGYCAGFEDGEKAMDYRDDENPGTWTYSNGKVTLKSNRTDEWGYNVTFTVKAGGKLYYNGKEVFHWVRGE